MNKYFLLLLSILFIFSSCDKKDDTKVLNANEYMIFGSFHGFCQGEQCVELFLLDSANLFEDKKDGYPNFNELYVGDYRALTSANYESTKSILNDFPSKLLTEKDTVFGCPDCVDQGGFYVEYKLDGKHKFWILDNNKASVPSYLHPFMDSMQVKIDALQ